MSSLAGRLAEVRHRIELAATAAGRSASEVKLVVVTKNHSVSTVLELYQHGARDFGENRDQEAAPKARELLAALAEFGAKESPTWHFVGQLQSNKVRSVLGYAAVLHSLDRISLLKELAKQLSRTNSRLSCFIQLNLTDNPDRGGVAPAQLIEFAELTEAEGSIQLLGLMAVADPRRHPESEFERVLRAREQLLTVSPTAHQLSIGMSGDFETAVRLGATHLRIGSAITDSGHSNA